jgi:hypothetical protein
VSTQTALIGWSGFVGGTLLRQTAFSERYRSSDIEAIRGREFDLLVCAGAPAAKWKANREPEADRENLERLGSALRGTRARRAVLISTVDVFATPVGVDERTPVPAHETPGYSRNRYWLEGAFADHFGEAAVTVRLPGLFGPSLRKNFLFDLLQNPDALTLTHHASVFQFYDMNRLWDDLRVVLEAGIPLVHFATEPVSAAEVAAQCFGVTFHNVTPAGPVNYDLQTIHGALFGKSSPYMASRAEVLDGIRRWAQNSRGTA